MQCAALPALAGSARWSHLTTRWPLKFPRDEKNIPRPRPRRVLRAGAGSDAIRWSSALSCRDRPRRLARPKLATPRGCPTVDHDACGIVPALSRRCRLADRLGRFTGVRRPAVEASAWRCRPRDLDQQGRAVRDHILRFRPGWLVKSRPTLGRRALLRPRGARAACRFKNLPELPSVRGRSLRRHVDEGLVLVG